MGKAMQQRWKPSVYVAEFTRLGLMRSSCCSFSSLRSTEVICFGVSDWALRAKLPFGCLSSRGWFQVAVRSVLGAVQAGLAELSWAEAGARPMRSGMTLPCATWTLMIHEPIRPSSNLHSIKHSSERWSKSVSRALNPSIEHFIKSSITVMTVKQSTRLWIKQSIYASINRWIELTESITHSLNQLSNL